MAYLAIFDKCRIHYDLVREWKFREVHQFKGLHIQQSIRPCKEQAKESSASNIQGKVSAETKILQRYTHFRHFFFFSEVVGHCNSYFSQAWRSCSQCSTAGTQTALCCVERCSAERLVLSVHKLSHNLHHQSQPLPLHYQCPSAPENGIGRRGGRKQGSMVR